MIRLFTFSAFLLAVAQPARSQNLVALRPGEAFTFQVGWGLFGDAGGIKVSATSETVGGKTQTKVTTHTQTQGLISVFYTFHGDVFADFDPLTGRLLDARAETMAGSTPTKMTVSFDYDHSQAHYVDPLHPARDAVLAMPSGQPTDMITALIQARNWNLKVGDSHPALLLFDNEFYEMSITAKRTEKISTEKGKRDAVVLVPSMIGPPKGMFKKGGAITVWISNDADRLPLKFEVAVKVGTATATLIHYQPPTPVAPKTATEPSPASPPATAPAPAPPAH